MEIQAAPVEYLLEVRPELPSNPGLRTPSAAAKARLIGSDGIFPSSKAGATDTRAERDPCNTVPVPPEKPHWAHLYKEVVTSGLCTGCAGCIIACPHDVLKYDDLSTYRPWKVEEDGGPEDCTHGVKGCTMCTRACPRFRTWETEIDTFMFGRERTEDEVAGISSDIVLARATDPELLLVGQDGGLVSAILVWALEHDVIDAALVSALADGSTWNAIPAVVKDREGVLATAGSRYTYSANTLAYPEAVASGAERIALVGMSCQASVPAVMSAAQSGQSCEAPEPVDRVALLQDLRRRDFRRPLRSSLRART